MKKKSIYISALSLLFLLAISCGNNANNVTTPNNSGNNIVGRRSSITDKYTAEGIDAKYNAVWKFFNTDETGNKAVDVKIENGGIRGLIVSNKNETVNFDKESIYCIKGNEEKNKYYDRYYGYIVSSADWIGEIHFPTFDDETVGYVYIKNKNNSNIIAGIIDKAPGPKEGINRGYFGKRSCTYNGIKRTVDVQENFVSYYENNELKLKIPSKFFDLSVGKGFYGYTVLLGPLYSGISINAHNSEDASILPNIYFEYIDYNYMLDIKVNEKGIPISAKYDKKVTVVSPGNIIYVKE